MHVRNRVRAKAGYPGAAWQMAFSERVHVMGKDTFGRETLGSRAAVLLTLSLSCAPLLTACGDHQTLNQDIGSAQLAITQVPADVACIRIDAAGVRSVQRDYDVTPGQSSILPLHGLPAGDVKFNANAFAGACAQVAPGSAPTWVGDPVTAAIVPGQIARVLIQLRASGKSLVGVDFVTDDKTGDVCVGNQPGCLSPEDATGTSTEPLPEGARLIASPEFGRGLTSGAIDLSSARIEEASRISLEKTNASDRDILIGLLKENNLPLERVVRPVVPDARLKPLGDGDYELMIDTEDGKSTQKVITHGEKYAISETLRGIQGFPSRANQLGIYNSMFDAIPEDVRGRLQLPNPVEVARLESDALIKFNESVAIRIADLNIFTVLDLPPAARPATCSGEEGTPGTATDQTGGSCSPKPTGIWQQNRFPLKWNATCVKNQANRGTCVSFGITGAAEAAISVKHNRWTNLCGYGGSAPGDSNFRVTSNLQLFSLFTPDVGLSLARALLAVKVPLVMALDVTPSFDNAASNGVATYLGANESSRGSHAVSVMGFVDNANLPANIPAGSGGGYLIVKNSWGKCWKDGGYIYLPYNWIKQYAFMLSTVSVN